MKMKHVSMFRLYPEYRTPELIEKLAQRLRELPAKVPEIIVCEIGIKPFPMPTGSPDGAVQFYDLIQMITFASEADCMAYPQSLGHQDFLAYSHSFFESVVGIDYPCT